ncbi:NUDIX domain-containing protein [Simiduia litorea]|uniref:NUDIX domain-containing protein n=1 Tax=Simiduia litorea TaxID=1435348 RepID=UPI0036F3BEA9
MSIPESPFTVTDVEVAQTKVGYKGFFRLERLKLRHKLFRGGWSHWFHRELFVRGEAVAAILYDPTSDQIGFIEQFRVGALKEPYGPWCLEVVAGISEPGESPAQVIVREIEEEAGVHDVELLPICQYLSSPGGSDERLHLYCAVCDLTGAGGVFGLADENEDIRLHLAPAAAVFTAMYTSRFNNAATLICLQWLQINHARLRSRS